MRDLHTNLSTDIKCQIYKYENGPRAYHSDVRFLFRLGKDGPAIENSSKMQYNKMNFFNCYILIILYLIGL